MPPRTRVLYLVDAVTDDAAGAERYVMALAQSMPRERYEVYLCTTRFASGRFLDDLRDSGVRHIDLARSGRFDVAPLGRLLRLLRRERIDVIHAHKFGSNIWASVLGRLARVPAIVSHEHSWSYEGQPERRLTDRFVIGKLSDAFVAVSEADRARMISLEHVAPAKTAVIPTAYLPREDVPAGDVRAELGIEPGVPIVGALGILRPQKALDVLIDAFVILRRSRPETRLVLAGSGESEVELRAYVTELGLDDVVHFLGHRNDADSVWQAFDVAAMSSDFEGMPVAAFEAMANGVPLVATRVGGLPEVIEDGVSGLLVPRRDPQALADAIGRLLDDPDLRARIAAAGRERVLDYGIDRLRDRTIDLYDRLLADSPRARS